MSALACLQADLCRLPKNLVQFDAVLAINVLERLPNPAMFLEQMAMLVKPSGVVVLTSSFSWSEHDTPKDNWLGGFYKVCVHQMYTLLDTAVCMLVGVNTRLHALK